MNSAEAVLQVAIDVPWRGKGLGLFDYWPPKESGLSWQDWQEKVGLRVVVPWGNRQVVGLLMGVQSQPTLTSEKIRHAIRLLEDVPVLSADWRRLVQFAAHYYKHALGEVALQSLPMALKEASAYKATKKAPAHLRHVAIEKAMQALKASAENEMSLSADLALPTLTEQQHAVLLAFERERQKLVPAPLLLHGVTGSGKTEVYLRMAETVLAQGRQVLVLVPEINLTPQLLARFEQRFSRYRVVTLHSELAKSERLHSWLSAHKAHADIVLGTRLAVLASLPRLGLVLVDEEHDPSYKQQEGVHYSARDLAVWRAHDLKIPVVLGSATPSLESWRQAEQGRYVRLRMSQRASGQATLPEVRLINTAQDKPEQGLTRALRQALQDTLAAGQQALIYLNRRGYAPVLSCDACGWLAGCPRCSAYVVMHKTDNRLHCHHCGWQAPVPRACPDCGNQDLSPVGRGTQRLEETLHAVFPQARLVRLDADSSSRKGSAQQTLQRVHAGDVDILIGTQMVAKGHDFANVGLVGVINADAALFSHDFRAAERLFAQLHQVIGRAGRRAQTGAASTAQALVQTRYPEHPLYQALQRHDDAAYYQQALGERREAHLPPWSYQALLRAEAKQLKTALDFLQQARELAQEHEGVRMYDAVPLALVRVAHIERAQMVLESDSRAQLQTCLDQWLPRLAELKTPVRWRVEVDPLAI
jgi:primosomal protein N' (replication factor Y)